LFGFIDMSAADSQRKSPTGSSNGAGNASGAAKHNKHDLAATVKVCSEGHEWFEGVLIAHTQWSGTNDVEGDY